MNVRQLKIGTPNDKQKQFLQCRKKYIAFGGARGGGKSWAVRTKAKLMALRYPGIRLLLVRRSYPEVETNHVRFLRAELAGIAEYRASARQFLFPNGSILELGYCACDSDLDRYQGAEFDVIFLDEATQLREIWMRQFAACLRGVNNFPKRIYYTCNPGGPGHSYIKRLFIDRRYEPGEDPEDYAFIPARVTDNQALLKAQPDYLKQLQSLPRKLREAWLEGKWDIFEGQFFQEFTDDPDHYRDRRFTHVIEPFEIPREWRIYRSYDFGYAKPFSCAWWAVDPDGVIYRILELYGCTGNPDEGVRWTPDKQFAEMRCIEDSHPWLKGRDIQGVADPAIWDSSRGESIYETALKYRIYFTKGDNRRIPGWMQLHYRMTFDEEGYPMMYIFNTCRAFLRTVPSLLFSDSEVEDLDTKQEDHVADECRYFCMSRPIPPRRNDSQTKPQDDPLDLHKGSFGSWGAVKKFG
ncbi:MAG: phage terminase large subunit [Eubacteriales bacterium]|nr:phage terminase large subunit [Eubacteriales bacterium]